MISERIKQLRKQNKWTQQDLANRLHVGKTTVSNYETGHSDPNIDMINQLSKIFGVSIGSLMGEPNDTVEMLGQAVTMNKYPYIDDYVSAGSPVTIEGMKDVPNIYVPDELLGNYAGSKRLFFLKVNGESMNKIIPNGSTIGVISYDSINDIKNGDIVVYSTEDHSFAVKYFYKEENKLIFKPSSTYHYYYDKVFDINDNIRIIGKVVIYSVML